MDARLAYNIRIMRANTVARYNLQGADAQMKTRGLGPHSRTHRLGYIDGRTYEAKIYNHFRDELIKHVGDNPSIPQIAIIERCSWIRLRLAMLDTKVPTASFTEQDSNCYLAWANSLGRLLEKLGLEPATQKPMTFADQMSSIADGGRAA